MEVNRRQGRTLHCLMSEFGIVLKVLSLKIFFILKNCHIGHINSQGTGGLKKYLTNPV